MASLLAPGVKAPSYALVRPKTAAANSLWAGTTSPGAGWVGTGGGWYTPPRSITATAIAQHPAWATPTAQPQQGGTLAPGTSGTTTTAPPAAPPALAPPAASPLDSTYFANVNANAAAVGNQIAGWNKQIEADKLSLQPLDYKDYSYTPATGGFAGVAGETAQKHAADILAARIAAQRRGDLGSTSLAQSLGAVDQGYQDRYTTAANSVQSAIDALTNQIGAAQTGQIQYEGGQRSDATDRAATLAQNDPSLGLPTTPLTNDQYLIRGGHAAPSFVLTPPRGAPSNAKWSGNVKPPGNWRGIGGGWYVPTGGKK